MMKNTQFQVLHQVPHPNIQLIHMDFHFALNKVCNLQKFNEKVHNIKAHYCLHSFLHTSMHRVQRKIYTLFMNTFTDLITMIYKRTQKIMNTYKKKTSGGKKKKGGGELLFKTCNFAHSNIGSQQMCINLWYT